MSKGNGKDKSPLLGRAGGYLFMRVFFSLGGKKKARRIDFDFGMWDG